MIMTSLALIAFVLLLAQIAIRTTIDLRLNLGENANGVIASLERSNIKKPHTPNAIASFCAQYPIRSIIGLVLAVRAVTFLLAWLLHMVRENRRVGFFDSIRDIWWRWDATGYMAIADHGYVNDLIPEKYNLVFYPLYPLIVNLFKTMGLPVLIAGMLVSLIAFCISAVLLYKLVERETKNTQLAWDCTKVLTIFPFSFYFAMPYTESLFLLMTLSCFWFLRDGKWILAGLFAALAGFTRNQGILLAVPFVVEIVLRWRNGQLHTPYRSLFGLALVPCGFLGYLAVNYYVSGNWFQFLIYQKLNWSQGFGFMPANVSAAFYHLQNADIHLALGTWLPTLICYFAAIGVLLMSSKVMPLPYLAYSAVYLLISYSPTWLLSGPRYLLTLFPLAIATGFLMQRSRHWQQGIEFIMLMGLGFFLLMYIQFQVY
ncbi:MAG: mannosyltransferase family protein [Deefgea sp.]